MNLPVIVRLPRTLIARIALVLGVAILFELAGIVALHRWQERELLDTSEPSQIARRLENAVTIAERAPPADRAELMHSLNNGKLTLNWVPSTVITDHSDAQVQLARTRERLLRSAANLKGRELRLSLMPGKSEAERDLIGVLAIADGSFISFRIQGYLPAPPPVWLSTILHVIWLAIVFGIAMLIVRSLVRPLGDLADAADRTRRNYSQPISATGPYEVQRLAHSFDAMRTRLIEVMQDNTQAMIAVSHDLRTPIQRLKLRASLLDDPEVVDAIGHDLAEMETFIDSTLAYVRSGLDEQPRLIDLAAILSTIVDDAADQGANIELYGPEVLEIHARPTTLIRVVQNLVANARNYGDRIEIRFSGQEGISAEISVEDDGPGIPPEQWADAIQPFRKLLPRPRKRAADNGALPDCIQQGAGLGLAFVHRSLAEQGGTLSLGASSLGGLKVTITIPDASAG